MSKKKLVDGDPCPHCGEKLVMTIPRQKQRGKRAYYYEWYLRCSNRKCPYMYMPLEAKRFWEEQITNNQHYEK